MVQQCTVTYGRGASAAAGAAGAAGVAALAAQTLSALGVCHVCASQAGAGCFGCCASLGLPVGCAECVRDPTVRGSESTHA